MDTRSSGGGLCIKEILSDQPVIFEIHTNPGEKDIWQFFYKCPLLFSLLLPFYPLFTSFTILVPFLSLSASVLLPLYSCSILSVTDQIDRQLR